MIRLRVFGTEDTVEQDADLLVHRVHAGSLQPVGEPLLLGDCNEGDHVLIDTGIPVIGSVTMIVDGWAA